MRGRTKFIEPQRHRGHREGKTKKVFKSEGDIVGAQMDDRNLLTHEVIGAAIEVHRELGPGLLESVYHSCMKHELRRRQIDFLSKAKVPLTYKGDPVDCELEIDLYFPGQLVAELKSVETILPVHEAQLLTYLKLTKTHIGLLINFNVPILKNGIKRMVF